MKQNYEPICFLFRGGGREGNPLAGVKAGQGWTRPDKAGQGRTRPFWTFLFVFSYGYGFCRLDCPWALLCLFSVMAMVFVGWIAPGLAPGLFCVCFQLWLWFLSVGLPLGSIFATPYRRFAPPGLQNWLPGFHFCNHYRRFGSLGSIFATPYP